VRSSILSFELSSAARTPKQQRCLPMPAECLPATCQCLPNTLTMPSNAIQCPAMPCGLLTARREAAPSTESAGLPDGGLYGLHFVISRSWPPLFDAGQLSRACQAGRRASSQAGSTCMSVCRARRLPPPLRTPPIHHHGYRRLRALPMAGFCAMCERSACYSAVIPEPWPAPIFEPWPAPMASTRSFLSLP